MTVSMVSPPSSPVVESNSYQSEFARLSAERERTRIVIEENEAELEEIKEEILKLKISEGTLSDNITKTQSELGTQQSKRTMLLQEKTRKKRVFDNDRKALEQCLRKAESLVEKETTNKDEFCKEIAPLIDEMEALMQKEHDFCFQQDFTILTVHWATKKQKPPSKLADTEAFQQSILRLDEIERMLRDEKQKLRASLEMLHESVLWA